MDGMLWDEIGILGVTKWSRGVLWCIAMERMR